MRAARTVTIGGCRFASFDGTEIAYRQWGPESTAVPVVLQHGFAVDSNVNWVAPGVVGALTSAGRRVITVDARGHGASAKPHDPERYGEEKMARDLVELLDLIGAPQLDLVGAPQLDLVGYSMGAVVSLIVAAGEPRLRRLVVGGLGASAVELGGVDTRIRSPDSVVDALTADDPGMIADPLAASFRLLADAVGADRFALAAQAQRSHSSRIPLAEIAVPTLVIAGERDLLAPRPEVLATAIPGARLEIVPGDHLGAVNAPEFTAAILEFLAL